MRHAQHKLLPHRERARKLPRFGRFTPGWVTQRYHGFNPLSLPLSLWLDASAGVYSDEDGSIPALDGDPVAVWVSQHDDDAYAFQATASKRPTRRFIDGIWRVTFDGVDDMLLLNTNQTAQVATLFAVASRASAYNPDQGLLILHANALYSAFNDADWGIVLDGAFHSGFTLASDPAVLSVLVRAANDVDLVQNSVLNNVTAGGGFQARGASAVGADPSDVQFHAGDVFHLLVCHDAVTAQQRAQTEKYLAVQSNVTL